MDISLRQLEAFIKVVEQRSFSKAGNELFLSQSTISSHIARLEQSLKTTLIRRSEKKNIELTEEGQRAYRAARNIINQAKMMQNMFRGSEEDQPIISIAASTMPASYILPDIIAGFSLLSPQCQFSVLDGDSFFSLERLQNDEAAFAFVGQCVKKAIFSYFPIYRDRLVLITKNNEEFAAKKAAGVLGKELLVYPMIMRESGSGTRLETENYLKRIGKSFLDLKIVSYMNNIEGIKNLVSSGSGITILSERAAADAIRDGDVLCFDLEKDGPYRDIYIAYRKNRGLTYIEQEFLDYVKRHTAGNTKTASNKNKT
jgi:DNA-binding transcriptional LysR family regulator